MYISTVDFSYTIYSLDSFKTIAKVSLRVMSSIPTCVSLTYRYINMKKKFLKLLLNFYYSSENG